MPAIAQNVSIESSPSESLFVRLVTSSRIFSTLVQILSQGLSNSDIEVSVDNGVVILNSTVNSRDEKRLTEEIAEEIPGVEDVENRIHVTLKGI